jgi:hypothetical protein
MLVLWGFFCSFFPGVLEEDGSRLGFGLGGAPPYFSSSSCVELYLVAAFNFSIVFVRSACCASRRWVTLSTRKL